MKQVYLTRRNLLTLLSKLDRTKAGDPSECTIIDREAGAVHSKDDPNG